MADTAFQIQFRQEHLYGYEQTKSILRDSVTTEAVIKGNQATFLVADSGNAEAVTRGINGRIPGRADNLNQPVVTLEEWHDVTEKTSFNIFSSQGNQRAIMSQTSLATINRKLDQQIIDALDTATQVSAVTGQATLQMVLSAMQVLTENEVKFDGQICAAISPAFLLNLIKLNEFTNADYIKRQPIPGADPMWMDEQGYYDWLGVKWMVHTRLPGATTNAETCYMYHKTSTGHAAPSNLLMTDVGYEGRDDYSYVRSTIFSGAALLQNTGVVKMMHDATTI